MLETEHRHGHEAPRGSWRELLNRRHAPAAFVLAAGVALYAINVYLTASMLPDIVAEIGGEQYYAWTATVFLICSVLSVTSVGSLSAAWGPRRSYLLALALFGIGSGLCAMSHDIAELLLGRAVQGLGGGLLSGLGYAVMNTALPARLWTYASGLVSAMWGVGTFVGPAAGGLFAQLHAWRLAFLALLVATALTAVATPFAFGPQRPRSGPVDLPSVLPLVLVASAALVASTASVVPRGFATVLALVAAFALLLCFFWADARARHGVFPPTTYAKGSRLPWVYLVIGALTAASAVEIFVPLFGQRLAGLSPLLAGFLGAFFALGWTVGEFPSVSARGKRQVRAMMTTGPLVTAVGLGAAGAVVAVLMGRPLAAALALCLFVAGVGVGVAWPHLAVLAMESVADRDEGARAAAGISVAQVVFGTFGAALTGVLVNLGEPDQVRSAELLLFGFAPLGFVGFFATRRALRS